jgi:hypothetical protein
MRVRAMDANGDYTFGRGSGNFLINSPAAVAQLVLTALGLLQGEWFLDKTSGMPWAQKVSGYGTQPFYDLAIRELVLGVTEVVSIQNYSSTLNRATRALTVAMMIITSFDPAPVPVNATIPL